MANKDRKQINEELEQSFLPEKLEFIPTEIGKKYCQVGIDENGKPCLLWSPEILEIL